METIHLKHNDGTKCGFKPPNFKIASCFTKVNCQECFDAHFCDFRFSDEVDISEFTKRISFRAFYYDQEIATVLYHYSGSFIPVVMNVWVDPNFRGRGLSSFLMKKMMKRVGPPIQLNAIPYCKIENEPVGIDKQQLKNFYSKLGFTLLKDGEKMLWYPQVKEESARVLVEQEGNYFRAYVQSHPDIAQKGTSYVSAVGELIRNHSAFFGIYFGK